MTWLPLLEKAYAKVHGDYEALNWASTGEAVEDLTGRVTTQLRTDSIVDREKLWKELEDPDGSRVFSLHTKSLRYPPIHHPFGLHPQHAYSIVGVALWSSLNGGKQTKLVRVRNPWGSKSHFGGGNRDGPWSNGSPEWTHESLKALTHHFRDNGTFYIPFEEMLEHFETIQQTRLFKDWEWISEQEWTQVSVPWTRQYHSTKFTVTTDSPGQVIFVLSQADARYFLRLEGRYTYHLGFVVRDGDGNHVVRSTGPGNVYGSRSVNATKHLEPGTYEVLLKIEAQYRGQGALSAEDVVKLEANRRPAKLQQIAKNYQWVVNRLKAEAYEVDPENVGTSSEGGKKREDDVATKADKNLSHRTGTSKGADQRCSYAANSPVGTGPSTERPQRSDTDSTEEVPRMPREDPTLTEHISSAFQNLGLMHPQPARAVSEQAQAMQEWSRKIVADPREAPWNARSIVGLKVYCKDGNVKIDVQNPSEAERAIEKAHRASKEKR